MNWLPVSLNPPHPLILNLLKDGNGGGKGRMGRNGGGPSFNDVQDERIVAPPLLNPPPNCGKAAENRQFANSAIRLIPIPQNLWYDGRRCEFRFPARRSGLPLSSG